MVRKIKNYKKELEKQEKEEKEKKLKEEKEKEDTKLKPFSLQSALGIVISSLIGGIAFPFLLSLFGVNINLGITLGNVFITSFGFAWTRFFIDSKRGYCKDFWKQYAIFAIIFGVISYFWMFRKLYI